MLGRSLKRIAAECKGRSLEVVDHGRAVKRRLLEICRAAQSLTPANQQRLRDSYSKLLGLTRTVVRQGKAVLERWKKGRLKVGGDRLQVQTQTALVEKVTAQTRERLWKKNLHVVGKVLSPHPGYPQRESRQAHRVWEAGADRRGGERYRERL